MASTIPEVSVKACYWRIGSDRLPPFQYYTHIYIGFAEVNPDNGEVTISVPHMEQFQNITTTAPKQCQLKLLLSIGGDKDSAADHISAVMRCETKRRKFIESSIDLAHVWNLHGLDLCWLYPSLSDKPADLVSFLTEWRDAVEEKAVKLLLTAAVFHDPVIPCAGGTFNYRCYTMNEKLDLINVMAIDFYTPSNSPKMTGPVHAWHTRPEDLGRCGSDGIGHWINNRDAKIRQVRKQKLVLCLPFYGYKWILDDPNNSVFFAPASPASFDPIPYRNIKQSAVQDNLIPYKDSEYIAAYKLNNDNWIGYENEDTIPDKVNVAIRKNNLGGYVAWDVGADDESWTLSRAAFNA